MLTIGAIAILALIALGIIIVQVIRDYRADSAIDKNRAQLKRERMKVRLEVERELETKPALSPALDMNAIRFVDMAQWEGYPVNDLYLIRDEQYNPDDTQSMDKWLSALDEIEGLDE